MTTEDRIPGILAKILVHQNSNDELFERMESDFDLLALTPFEPEEQDLNAYTSPAPLNYFNKIIDGLSRAQLTIQIKQGSEATEDDRRAASLGEQFIFGGLHAIDRRLGNMGEPPLRDQMNFHVAARGWYAVRGLVYTPEGKDQLVFDFMPWDVMHMAWEVGPNGLIWAAYQYEMTASQAKDAYDEEISGETVTVTDYWDTEQNGVIIKDHWGKGLTDHNIGHVPVLVGKVGSMPSIIRRDNVETTTHLQGESVWGASRGIYEHKNRYTSWIMDLAKNAVAGSIIHESTSGTKKLANNPYLTYTEIQLSTSEEERIYPLELPKMPAEFNAVINLVDSDEQQATLPAPLAYGGIEGELSGRAIEYLSEATRSQYSPRTEAMARIYTWISEEMIAQFKKKGQRKPAKVSGYTGEGEFFQVTVKPGDVDAGWFVAVSVEPRLPRDREQELRSAQIATADTGSGPIMSMATAREELVHLRDPDAEADKTLVETGERLEPIQIANIAAALDDRGKPELAEQVRALSAPSPAGAGGSPPSPSGAEGGSPPPLPPELIEAVVQGLVESGQQELAQAFVGVIQQSMGEQGAM